MSADPAKKNDWLLYKLESRFRDALVAHIPAFITGKHLTLLSVVWIAGLLLFGYLASYNIGWLWGSSAMIVFHWFSDLFDGAVARYRKEGTHNWGFFMDHLLDYFFLCAYLIGYSFILPQTHTLYLFFYLALFGGFMVISFLSYAVEKVFHVSHMGIGPAELHVIFIIVNTLFIFFGKTHLAQFTPFIFVGAFVGLIYVIYTTQKRLWILDRR